MMINYVFNAIVVTKEEKKNADIESLLEKD